MVKKAFLFPGQGTQYVGMGKKLCSEFSVASETFDEASEALSLDLKKLCFEGNIEELTLSYNAQPAILVTSVATYRVLEETMKKKPDIMAGHSLGELSALTCAGAIDFPDAVKIVRKRGQFMQDAVANGVGAMAAVETRDHDKVKELCKQISTDTKVLGISNYNSRKQIVISGHKEAVEEAIGVLEKDGIKSKKLKVSAPFHCALMQPAAEMFEQELSNYKFHDMKYPVLSNVDGKPYAGKEVIIKNLVSQIVMPVQWSKSMDYLKMAMIQYAVEVGPGKVLKNLMKTNHADIKMFAYDNASDAHELEKYVESLNIPFLSRSLGIAVSTQNTNWNQEEYLKGVIEPYNKIEKMQAVIENEGRTATMDEMNQAIQMLLILFKTKGVKKEEQIALLQELFSDTGMEETFEEFDFSVINQ